MSGCYCHTDMDLVAQPAATKAGMHRKRARGTEAADEATRERCFWKGR